jgi:Xaa-Pro aminopeptidase
VSMSIVRLSEQALALDLRPCAKCLYTVIPSEDSHSSEYIAAADARRPYISGFTGSAGVAVVTAKSAVLSTDGRYIIQATKQLDSNWTLFNSAQQDAQTWQDWAAEQSAGGKNVAVDPSLLPASAAKKLAERIHKCGGADLLPLEENLVDIVWAEEKPARPAFPVTALPDSLTGRSVQSKLRELRQDLEKKHAAGFLVSMLDEIAWLFNLRGRDIPFNPVFFSYALITPDTATLYVDEAKLDAPSKVQLQTNGIEVKPYEAAIDDARKLSAKVSQYRKAEGDGTSQRLLLSNRGSWALQRALGGDDMVDDIRSPIGDYKAIKNDVELAGMRACHVRDGAAQIEYFAWLEDQLVAKRAVIDEVEAADKLEELRAKHDRFVGLSFPTISSSGAK